MGGGWGRRLGEELEKGKTMRLGFFGLKGGEKRKGEERKGQKFTKNIGK